MKKISKKSLLKPIAALLIALTLFAVTAASPHEANESYVRSRVVMLEGNGYGCTGIQVHTPHGKDLLLSAGHCNALIENGTINASLDDGRAIPRKVLEEDKKNDLLILEGMPDLRGIEIASSSPMHHNYTALTHGGGEPTHRADGEYMEEKTVEIMDSYLAGLDDEAACNAKPHHKAKLFYCLNVLRLIATTIKVEPGSSGGPIVNRQYKLVGIVSASGNGFSFIVPLKDVQAFIAPY